MAADFKVLAKSAFKVVSSAFFVLVFCVTFWAPAQVFAQTTERLETLRVTGESTDGYGRIVLTFPERFDLPAYEMSWDNGILVITFESAANVILPDLSANLPDFVAAARTDPDKKGIRIGLKKSFTVNKTEAGESLYLDMLPEDWTGIEPGLPRYIVERLSQRARDAATLAEQQRKLDIARSNPPSATMRVGRHPTFLRLVIDWSIDVEANYSFEDSSGELSFDWPVPIDLFAVVSDLPDELLSVDNAVGDAGSSLRFQAAEGVVPRFYANSSREYVIDIDIEGGDAGAVDLASLLPKGDIPVQSQREVLAVPGDGDASPVAINVPDDVPGRVVTPFVRKVGSTVRVVFPFERDTPAAVFRRADTLWMIFDTNAAIGAPANDGEDGDIGEIAEAFSVLPAGDTSIVRINLNKGKLATLGSEGRSWVLSLGDIVLVPEELVTLQRRQTAQGLFEIVADLRRPSKVHQLLDPEVGDVLEVVTVFPPARGIVRDFKHVDFAALRSVHGLVVQPWHEGITVGIEGRDAIIRSEQGLILSTRKSNREDQTAGAADTETDLNLASLIEEEPPLFSERLNGLMQFASVQQDDKLAAARLEIAKFYLANEFPHEALGLIRVIEDERISDNLADVVELVSAAASTMAGRWDDANIKLNSELMADVPESLVWRTIARVGAFDFAGARTDALAAELSLGAHPDWLQQKFLVAAVVAAIEERDVSMATRFIGMLQPEKLDRERLSQYQVLSARIDHEAGRFDEALDTLGRVIASDVRSTRAEAIYRTMLLLEEMGRLDVLRGAETLASEVTVWRGNALEAKMLKFLAELYFKAGEYRDAFETTRALAQSHPDRTETDELLVEAQTAFSDLYLNGQADALQPVDALTLYYDFRNFTPAGARGDEMVRNLARRLIRVDLLDQAADLLQYQVDSRLEGAAKSQIAADLAVIYLADRRPDKALRVLNNTRVAGITPGLERQRRILEARALVDAGREDLALDVMTRLDGRDVELLRVDAHWRAKRYQEASEILELLYTPALEQNELSTAARNNVVKAAVGFVLANDQIGIVRLRERFAEPMSQTPEWPLFSFVTGRVEVTSLEFRKIAKQVAGADSLNGFLTTYSEIYDPEGALSPKVSSADDA